MKQKKKDKTNSKKIIDLTSYVNSQMAQHDVNGSYTGTTKSSLLSGKYEKPEQDADDL